MWPLGSFWFPADCEPLWRRRCWACPKGKKAEPCRGVLGAGRCGRREWVQVDVAEVSGSRAVQARGGPVKVLSSQEGP